MAPALQRGFATASTDTGHTPTEPQLWLEDEDLVVDYSYRGLHLTMINAKAIIAAFYNRAPSFSYYSGCSTGEKQALFEAQRYPSDYDGIVGGDAANFWTHQMFHEDWVGQATVTPETNLSPDNLQLVNNAVLQQCTGKDHGLSTEDYTTLNFDSDVTLVDKDFSSLFNSTNPDLSEFKRRGGKLIMYHGYADPLISPANTINYYNSVASTQPSYRLTRSVASAIAQTQGFFRLFLVPGMYHCAGGPGTNIFNGVANQGNPTDPVHDILSALDSWVAGHEAPDEIIASNQSNGVVNFTRPLCPYPQNARYTGTDSTSDAANFICAQDDDDLPTNFKEPLRLSGASIGKP